jgi:hypothetical protein
MSEIERLKAQLSLTDELGRYCRGRRGNRWLCPACSPEKEAALGVFDEGRRWHCHRCDVGGDVLDFIAFATGRSLEEVISVPGAGNRQPVTHRAAGTSGSEKRPAPDVGKLWWYARDGALAAGSADPTVRYVTTRLGEAGQLLFSEGLVGIVDRNAPDAWARCQNRSLAIPLHIVPPPGQVIGPVDPATLALRFAALGDPPDGRAKILRLPAAASGHLVTYGYLPSAILHADAHVLIVVEGAFDYLAFRAACRDNVVGLFSANDGRKLGAAIRSEIEQIRMLGVGGPERVVMVEQDDDKSRGAMLAVAQEIARLKHPPRLQKHKPNLGTRAAAS